MIFCILGFIFVAILGTLSHFFYNWSGNNKVVGIIFPANESTWEHLKLAIFPTIIYFIFGLIYIKNQNYLFAFFVTLILPMILIPAIFYTYTAFVKNSILIVDILSYYLSIFIAFLICYKILCLPKLHVVFNIVAIIGLTLIFICYLTFTLNPPEIFLFRDSVTGHYGLKK